MAHLKGLAVARRGTAVCAMLSLLLLWPGATSRAVVPLEGAGSVGDAAFLPDASDTVDALMKSKPPSIEVHEGGAALGPASTLPTRDQLLLEKELGIAWQKSTAVGLPYSGALQDGVLLPDEGQNFFTWDAVEDILTNPEDRRWGTDTLVLTLLAVLDEYRAANPDAPRVGISDLSRREGGKFGPEYGGSGHRSHQNGLDVDIAYPRADGEELGISDVSQVDLVLSQDLIDRFVAHGAQFVFVGENTPIEGPGNVVKAWPYHDDHLHLRILSGNS